MNQSSKVLEGVPRVGYDLHLCPFPACVEAILRYRGEKVDFDYIAAVAGAPFRRFYHPTDGGNVDLMYLGTSVLERTFAALGYEYQHVPPYDRDALIKVMKASIDADRPLISFGIVGPPEAGIIAGYEKDGEVLVGWSYFQPNRADYYRQPDWKPCLAEGLGFVVIGDKKPNKPTKREVLVSTIILAIDLARSPRQLSHPDHVNGLAAYEAWAKDCENDALFAPADKENLATRGMIRIDQCDMLMDRKSAATFLRQLAPAAPEAREPLEAAARLYEQIAPALNDEMAAFEPRFGPGGITLNPEKVANRQLRLQLSAAIRDVAKQEEQAIRELEKALSLMSPLPANAELTTPRPQDLTIGGRRAPEDMGAAIVMRACGDLLGINSSGQPPETIAGGWRVDPNQTLLMAATGQSFEWAWLPKPGQNPERGWEYHLDDPAKPLMRALWSLGLDGDVNLFPPNRQPSEVDLRRQIAYSLHYRQLPAILLGQGPLGEYFLVTAYADAGKTLSGWKTGGGGPSIIFEPDKRETLTDWCKNTRGAIVLKSKTSLPIPQQLYRVTLTEALTSLKRTEAGPYLAGQAMQEAWCKAIVDPALDASDETTAQRRQSFIDPTIWDLAERRWYGSMFLKNAAKVFPAAEADLLAAADDFQAIHDLMYAIMRSGDGTTPGGPIPHLSDSKARQEMARLMKEAAAKDADATARLEAAKLKLGP